MKKLFTRLETSNLSDVAGAFSKVIKNILSPVLGIIGVLLVVYVVYLGVMYAKAESADKRKEIQSRLIASIVGAVIVIAGATLCLTLDWTNIFKNFANANDANIS